MNRYHIIVRIILINPHGTYIKVNYFLAKTDRKLSESRLLPFLSGIARSLTIDGFSLRCLESLPTQSQEKIVSLQLTSIIDPPVLHTDEASLPN